MVRALTEAGLVVECIRAAHKPTERTVGDVNVFVTSLAVSSFGLNLYHCCADGIIAQFSWSFGALHQATGRITRLGQKLPVTWTIIKTDFSFYNVQEQRLCIKWAKQLLTTMTIPELITGRAAELLVYEVMKQHWSQPFNRLVWEANPPKSVYDFESDEYEKFGSWFSHNGEMHC